MQKQSKSTASFRSSALGACLLGLIGSSSSVAAGSQFERALAAYEQGRYSTAFQLVKSHAEQGEAQAQHVLGIMYRKGIGVAADEYTAFEWCKQAAESGLLEAQFQLGLMYLEGEGVTEDDDEAQRWLWAAADRGYPQATEVLQFIFSEDYSVGC